MRHPLRNLLLFVALLGAAVGFTSLQRPDLSANIFTATTIPPQLCVASACTGSTVDLANYASAFGLVNRGFMVIAAGTRRYVVLQDSAVADLTWNNIDSVYADTFTLARGSAPALQVGYHGAKRYLRLLARAGTANDTMTISGVIVRGNARFKN
jgi:hypothetical protein